MKIKYYRPIDNSHAVCIETGEQSFPAGTLNSRDNEFDYDIPPIILKITRQPYYKKVTFMGKFYLLCFVDGVDEITNLHYTVLYIK